MDFTIMLIITLSIISMLLASVALFLAIRQKIKKAA